MRDCLQMFTCKCIQIISGCLKRKLVVLKTGRAITAFNPWGCFLVEALSISGF